MHLLNLLELYRKHVDYGKKLKINGLLCLHGHGKIVIGDNCIITSSGRYNPTDGSSKTHLSTKQNGILDIGNNVGISNTAITASEYIKIGNDVMIGSGCMISDTDHHSIFLTERLCGNGTFSAPILIGDGAFLGARTIVLKGVTIGKEAVIGAGSVVTKDIPDREVWAGNPVKFVKKI